MWQHLHRSPDSVLTLEDPPNTPAAPYPTNIKYVADIVKHGVDKADSAHVVGRLGKRPTCPKPAAAAERAVVYKVKFGSQSWSALLVLISNPQVKSVLVH